MWERKSNTEGRPPCPTLHGLTFLRGASTKSTRSMRYNRARSVSGGAMKLDLLAMAAHPDDVELTCGGTLIKMARQGYAVGILDLTGGEMGTRRSVETRRKEAAAAARILGVAHRENLGLPATRLDLSTQYQLSIAQRIPALRPTT